MKILVIGGTRFVGRHFVEAALGAGHEVTLFHRGQTNPGLFEEAQEVFGDRSTDIDRLKGHWDVVVDTCGYFPEDVQISADHLRTRADRYLFVSTISVYRDWSQRGIDEEAPLKTLELEGVDEINASTYGPLKTACEAVVTGQFDHRSLIVRPGIIAGPHDQTDRFTYWAARIADGGEVLAPGYPSADVQLIDARDLAQWLVEALQDDLTGIYNATGETISFETMLEACKTAAGSDATFSWVPADFLHEMELDSGAKMPLWNRESKGRRAGLYAIDSSRAQQEGLTYRPLEETARDTQQYSETRTDHEWKAGIDRLQEREILDVWHGRAGAGR